MPPSPPSPYSSKERFTATLLHAFNGPDSEVKPTFLTLYNEDTILKINGTIYSFDEFLAHVANVRRLLTNFEIKSHAFLRDGNMVAEKHTLRATRKEDGKLVGAEGYIFGELNDGGRAFWVDEQARSFEL